MTYIMVSKSEEAQKLQLQALLKKLFKKDIQQSPDIHILDPLEKNSIGIEEIKVFQKEMVYRPFEESIQVGIISQSQKLTTQAQNALLKTLEDTSKYSIYILCVDNERNLLPTIRSRGQVIYSAKELNTLDSVIDNENKDILDMNLLDQFNIVEKYSKEKSSSLELINDIERLFKEKLELDIKNGNIDSSKRNMGFLKIIQNSREKISANCNRRLTLEAMMVQLNASH